MEIRIPPARSVVDWDRVDELKEKGWDWNRIASDPKVAFHPDSSVQQAGPALRRLYYRRQSRSGREAPAAVSRKADPTIERKWTIARVGFLLTPIFGIWFLVAYLAPSPVGLVLAAIPWLAIGLAVGAFLLAFGLLRTNKRWSKVLKTTLILGIVAGIAISGIIGLVGVLAFGCPYLPPSSSLHTQSASGQPNSTDGGVGAIPPWQSGGMAAWQDGGKPVVYFYGASWCPYCSAASWAIYEAVAEFSTSVTNVPVGYSSLTDSYAGTPEIVLANANVVSSTISFQVSEYTGGVDGTFAGTSNCYQQAYVTAYSASSIPFVVINGQYIHGGSQIVYPQNMATWNYASSGSSGGANTVYSQVHSQSGTAWNQVSFQTYWMMAFIARSTGVPVSQLSTQYGWSSTTTSSVQADVNSIS